MELGLWVALVLVAVARMHTAAKRGEAGSCSREAGRTISFLRRWDVSPLTVPVSLLLR